MNIKAPASGADPEQFVRGGPTLTGVFLGDGGKEDPNTTTRRAIIGPPAKRHLNDVYFCWRADNGFTLNAGLKAL